MSCQTADLIPLTQKPSQEDSRDYCRMVLCEPNSPTLQRYMCRDAIDCGGNGLTVEAYGVDGVKITLRGLSPPYVTQCGSTCRLSLPVAACRSYWGPLPSTLSRVKELNTILCNATVNSPLVDGILPLKRVKCRLKLYCRGVSIEDFEKTNTNTLYPRLVIGRAYSWIRTRARRDAEFEAPWLCIRDNMEGSAISIVCTERERTCRFQVSASGVIRLVEGRALLLNVGCAPVELAKAYLHGLMFDVDGDVNVKPCVWSRTGLLVVGFKLANMRTARERGRVELFLAVWNPYPIARLHTLAFERHRVVGAKIVTPYGWEEELIASYNQVKIPLPRHGLRIVRLVLKPLPPLLRRR